MRPETKVKPRLLVFSPTLRVMPKNRRGPAGAYKLCHMCLKISKLKLQHLL